MQKWQSTKRKLKYHPTDKKRALTSGTLIAVVILVTPYLFYLYQGFPAESRWESFFGVYESRFYESVQVVAWVLFGKFIPLLLLLIWFFTCKHWWYHVLLVPMCMYVFQVYTTISNDVRFADTNEFFVIAPIVFVMAIFSYTIRMKVFDKVHGIDFGELARGNWKGEIKSKTEENPGSSDEYDDEEEEPLFMG